MVAYFEPQVENRGKWNLLCQYIQPKSTETVTYESRNTIDKVLLSKLRGCNNIIKDM